jgi:hypothetical protein
MASAPDQHPLVRKLESITDLTPEERQALLDLPMKVQAIGADQDIVREGDRPSRCCVVLQRWPHKARRSIGKGNPRRPGALQNLATNTARVRALSRFLAGARAAWSLSRTGRGRL